MMYTARQNYDLIAVSGKVKRFGTVIDKGFVGAGNMAKLSG